jgi:hypothetical protein
MHAWIVALSLASQGGQVVGLAVQPPVGLSAEEVAPIKDKVTDEIGVRSMMVVSSDAVDPACAPEAACVEQVRQGLDEAPSALIVIELIRVGPVVQLSATATAGDQHATGTHALDEQQLKTGPVLPKEIEGWLDALAKDHQASAVSAQGAGAAEQSAPAVDAETASSVSPMRIGAIAALGGGALLLLVGGVVAASQEGVLGDSTTTGADKEAARTGGLAGLGLAAAGVVALGGGAALLFLE